MRPAKKGEDSITPGGQLSGLTPVGKAIIDRRDEVSLSEQNRVDADELASLRQPEECRVS